MSENFLFGLSPLSEQESREITKRANIFVYLTNTRGYSEEYVVEKIVRFNCDNDILQQVYNIPDEVVNRYLV